VCQTGRRSEVRHKLPADLLQMRFPDFLNEILRSLVPAHFADFLYPGTSAVTFPTY
jgi:hypothetical protein